MREIKWDIITDMIEFPFISNYETDDEERTYSEEKSLSIGDSH